MTKKSAFRALAALIPLAAASYSAPVQADIRLLMRAHERSSTTLTREVTETVRLESFEQRLNHFDPNDARTFQQQFFFSETHAPGPDAPFFISIGGEGAGPTKASGLLLALAKKYGGYMAALEHRYYGKSQPFGDLSTENLKYLTTELALEDLAHFIRTMKKQHGLTGKVFTIGGSYAGSLSAYMRLKYPALIDGALSSSGPVETRLNFEEYDKSTAASLPPACLLQVRAVTTEVENAAASSVTWNALKAKFGAQVLTNSADLLYVVADTAAFAVQYGDTTRFCSSIATNNIGDAVTAYAKETQALLKKIGLTFADVSPEGLARPEISFNDGWVGFRQWTYQTCTEYGYFQNAYHDPQFAARSDRINPAYHERMCERVFGKKLQPDIARMNANYYLPLLDANTTQIFFTNGSTDPWRWLSINPERKNTTNPNTAAYLIRGAAHCDDLNAPSSTESQSMKAARSILYNQLETWQ